MVSTAAKRPIVIALASLFQILYWIRIIKCHRNPNKKLFHGILLNCQNVKGKDLSLEWIYKALPQPDLILWGVWEFVVSAVTHKGNKKPQLSLLTLNFVSVVRSAHEHFFSPARDL